MTRINDGKAWGEVSWGPRNTEIAMKINIGTLDRVVRAVVGVALITWAILGGPLWAWVGVIPLVTAAVRICPAYSLLGISSCKTDA